MMRKLIYVSSSVCAACVAASVGIAMSLSTLAFRPPRPPTYELVAAAAGVFSFSDGWTPQTGLRVPRSPIRIAAPPPDAAVAAGLRASIVMLRESRAALHIKHARASSTKHFTLLFSHGTSFDLGMLRDHCVSLAALLGCDVLAYDYTGYGSSSSLTPTEAAANADAEAALSHLVASGVPVTRIVLYGLSLGVGPTLHLASGSGKNAAGVVLRSGYVSGSNVVFGPFAVFPFGAFNNRPRALATTAPVLVIHGHKDELIGLWQAEKLAALCPAAVPSLLLPERGHFNIEQAPECAAF